MSFTTNKYLEKPANGSNVDTWDVPLNDDFNIIDEAFGGLTPLNAGAGSATLTLAQYRPLILSITGTLVGNITYTIPSGIGGQWIVRNAATGGSYTITIASGGGGSYVIVDRNVSTVVYSDGTNIRYADNWVRPSLAAGSSTQIQYNTSGILDASANLVYSGGKLGVGTASPTQALEVAGTVYSTTGGFKFPDGSVQTSASTGAPSSYVATISFGSTGLLPSTASSGAVAVAGTLNVANGGTGATSASVARTNLGAATAGSNSDITSISGLTTALTVAQGGTGQTSYTNGQILIGNSATNSLTKATITGGSGITVNNGNGIIEIVASGTSGVGTFSGGTTGLTPATPTAGAVVLSGTLAVANGGTGITAFGSGVGTALGQGVTGSGGIVLANSPTLVTPNLGTPSTLTLTNATGLALTSGVTGVLPVANGGTGVTSSTGTGSVVLSASPTFTGTLNAAAVSTTSNYTSTGTISVNTGGATSGAAISVRNGGDIALYNAADTGSATLSCDTNGELKTAGTFVASGSVKASATGFIFPDNTTQSTAFPTYGAGYQLFPGGLNQQFGQSSVGASTSVTITLPYACPTAVYTAYLTEIHNSTYAGPYATIGVEILSNTQIRVWNNNGYSMGFFWFVVGY